MFDLARVFVRVILLNKLIHNISKHKCRFIL